MDQAKLYLICPECHVEPAIKAQFGPNSLFLSALGAVFDFSELDFAKSIDDFIERESISEIIIVSNVACNFIHNVISETSDYKTFADQELKRLRDNNIEKFSVLNLNSQKQLLAKLNIFRQAYELLDTPYLTHRISYSYLSISGLTYDPEILYFKSVILDL